MPVFLTAHSTPDIVMGGTGETSSRSVDSTATHLETQVADVQQRTCLAEADLAGLQEVVQAAGRGNDNLHAVLQVPQLPVLWRAAVAAPVQQHVPMVSMASPTAARAQDSRPTWHNR